MDKLILKNSPLIKKEFSSQGNSRYNTIFNLVFLLRSKFTHFYVLFDKGNSYIVDHNTNKYVITLIKKTPKTNLAIVVLPIKNGIGIHPL